MPATSSAPGSQPESVARKNAKAQTKAVVKTVAKSTAKAVTAGAGTAVVAAPVAASVSSTASAPSRPRRSSRNSGRRSRPEPLQYKPPKPIAVKVKQDLKTLGTPKALEASKKPVYVAPHLQASVHATKHRTLIAPSVAHQVAKRLNRAQPPQKAQVPQKPQRAPKPQVVKHKLKAAAKKAKPKLDVSAIPDMGNAREIAPTVKRMAEKRGEKPSVLMAQIEQESGFNPLATEQGGSVSNTPSASQGGGETQFIPTTAASYGVKYGAKPKQVRSQLKGQANYMQDLGGTTADALGAYYGDHDPNGAYAQGILANASKYAALDAPAGKGKPIPQDLKDRAKAVLGPKQAAKVIAHAKHPPSAPEVKPLSGPLSGSKTFVQKLVGSKVHSDHGVKNEGTIHAAGGYHYDPHSYAQDINNPAGNPAEGEPPFSQATLDKITRNARKQGFDVPKMGIPALATPGATSFDGTSKGYRLQIFTDEGSGPHIHVGVRWEGAGATTTSTSSTGTAITAGISGTSTPSAGPATSSKRKQTHHRRHKGRKRRRQAARVRLSSSPAPLNPADYTVSPSTESYSAYIKKAPARIDL